MTVDNYYDLQDKVLQIKQFGACPAAAAVGDVNNDQLTRCRICTSNGWPREAIIFEKVLGRVRSDGTNDVVRWIIRDYFTGMEHKHKTKQQQDNLERRIF